MMLPALHAEESLSLLRITQIASGNVAKDDMDAAKKTVRLWEKSARFATPEVVVQETKEWTLQDRMDAARAVGFAVEVVSNT